jgi:hypothetical protein
MPKKFRRSYGVALGRSRGRNPSQFFDARVGSLGLFSHGEMSAAVLLPALFLMFVTERPFLSVTHGLHAIGGHSQGDQKIFCRLGSPVA